MFVYPRDPMAMPSITPYSHWMQRSPSGGFPQPPLNQTQTVSAQTPSLATAGGISEAANKLAQAAAAPPPQEQPPQMPPLDVNGDGFVNELDSNPVATDPNNQKSPPVEGDNSTITDPLSPTGGVGQMPSRPPALAQNKPPIGVTAKTAILQRRAEEVAERAFAGTVTRDEVIKLAHDYGVGTEITEVYNRALGGEEPQVVYRSVMGLDDHGVPLEKSAGMEKQAIGFLALSAILAALGAVGTAGYRGVKGTSQGLVKDLWQGGFSGSGLGLLPWNLINKDLGDATTGWAPSLWGARGSQSGADLSDPKWQNTLGPKGSPHISQQSPAQQQSFIRFKNLVKAGLTPQMALKMLPGMESGKYHPNSPFMQRGIVDMRSPSFMMGLRGGATPFGRFRDEDLYRQGLRRGRRKALRNRRRRRRRRRGGRDRLPAPAAAAPTSELSAISSAPAAPAAASPAAPAPVAPAPAMVHPGTSPSAPFPSHPTPGRAEPDYVTRRGSIPDDAWGDSYKSQANAWDTDMSNPMPPENVHDPIEGAAEFAPGYRDPFLKGSQYLAMVEKSASDAGIVMDPLAIGFVARCCERGMSADQIVLAAEKTAESFPGLAEKLAMDKEAFGWLRGLIAGAKAIPGMFGAGGKSLSTATSAAEKGLPFLSKVKAWLGGARGHVGEAAQAGSDLGKYRQAHQVAERATRQVPPEVSKALLATDVEPIAARVAAHRGPLSKAPWFTKKDELGKILTRGKINRVWNAPWAHPFRGAATGGFLGQSVDSLGDLTGAYDTGGMGAKLGLGLGFGMRSPWARAAYKAAPVRSATRKALNIGKNMTTMGGWHRYGRKVGWPTEAAFWAPLPLGIAAGVGESKAVAKGNAMAQQMGFDSYQDLLTSPMGQGIAGYNKSGILGALSGVWGSLSPQQKTTMIAALGLGGAGLVSAMSGKTGLGLGLGAAGLGVGAYGMGAFGNAPGSLESVLSGANLSPEQAEQLQGVFKDSDFADQFYNLPKGQQSEVMQNILKQLQAA